jgi:hypothetical protein
MRSLIGTLASVALLAAMLPLAVSAKPWATVTVPLQDASPVDTFNTYTGVHKVDWMQCCDCHAENCYGR